MDYKIEVTFIPVSDVDRAKAFYSEQLGFHVDIDQRVHESLRFVQLTPPGSACSMVVGDGLTDAAPGSAITMIVIDDVEQAHRELSERGAPVTDIDEQPWGRFVYVKDPDGNTWNFQQLPERS